MKIVIALLFGIAMLAALILWDCKIPDGPQKIAVVAVDPNNPIIKDLGVEPGELDRVCRLVAEKQLKEMKTDPDKMNVYVLLVFADGKYDPNSIKRTLMK